MSNGAHSLVLIVWYRGRCPLYKIYFHPLSTYFAEVFENTTVLLKATHINEAFFLGLY